MPVRSYMGRGVSSSFAETGLMVPRSEWRYPSVVRKSLFLDDVREWIFEKYVEASYANRHPIHPDYSATIDIPGMNLDGGYRIDDYKLRVDQRVVNPIVIGRPHYVEVQFPVAFYNKVRYFVKTYFPDVEEGKVIRAIAILFNNSVNFLKLGWDNPRDKFQQMYGNVEPRNESFPRIDTFPFNWYV